MQRPELVQDSEFPEEWRDDKYKFSDSRPAICFSIDSPSGEPGEFFLRRTCTVLLKIEPYLLDAAKQILDNYTIEHFRNLGVDPSRLPAETPEAIASAIVLESAHFTDPSGTEFELGFGVPWDVDGHEYVVEFEGGVAQYCSVNG